MKSIHLIVFRIAYLIHVHCCLLFYCFFLGLCVSVVQTLYHLKLNDSVMYDIQYYYKNQSKKNSKSNSCVICVLCDSCQLFSIFFLFHFQHLILFIFRLDFVKYTRNISEVVVWNPKYVWALSKQAQRDWINNLAMYCNCNWTKVFEHWNKEYRIRMKNTVHKICIHSLIRPYAS